jgi:hypothetical protein
MKLKMGGGKKKKVGPTYSLYGYNMICVEESIRPCLTVSTTTTYCLERNASCLGELLQYLCQEKGFVEDDEGKETQ